MTVSNLFNQLKAGKITKEQFLYQVRKDSALPWISPLTTFNEAIKILQNKGIIFEAFEMESLEEGDTCFCGGGGTYEPHEDAGEKICASCGDRQPISKDDREYDDMEVKHDIEKGAHDSVISQHDLEENTPSLKEQVLEFVKKAIEGGSSMEEAKQQAKEYFEKEPAALNEAKVHLDPDHVNPYELTKGIDMEMGYADKAAPSWAQARLMDVAALYAKAQAKALKNLAKDPAYYTNQIAGKKKEKVVKTVWDGYTKGTLAAEDKANVKVKKEGPVKGAKVKTMPDKGVTGSEKVIKEEAMTSAQDKKLAKAKKIKEYVAAQLKKEAGDILQTQAGDYITATKQGQGKIMAADLAKKGIRATVKTVNEKKK